MLSTFEVLGNAQGKKILDFGGGTGIYAKKLTKMGSIVKGFDISREMLQIAKRENPTLDLKFGSGNKIPFNEKFDIVLASLIISYIISYFTNLDDVFKQVSKVLKKKGYFIFSRKNPVAEVIKKINIGKRKFRVLGINNYFEENKQYGVWGLKRGKIQVPRYHKTYETIIKTILENNFEICAYKDTFPTKESKKLFPKYYKIPFKIPYFCVWNVRLK